MIDNQRRKEIKEKFSENKKKKQAQLTNSKSANPKKIYVERMDLARSRKNKILLSVKKNEILLEEEEDKKYFEEGC